MVNDPPFPWHIERSASARFALRAVVVLVLLVVEPLAFWLGIVRPIEGLPATTAGLTVRSLREPSPGQAVYSGRLRGPSERVTPTGHPAVVYRWRVESVASDGAKTRLCGGAAEDELELYDPHGHVAIEADIRDEMLVESRGSEVPERLTAVCSGLYSVPSNVHLEYVESVMTPEREVESLGCVSTSAESNSSVLSGCEPGVRAAVFARNPPPDAHRVARMRLALAFMGTVIVCLLGLGAGALLFRSRGSAT